MAARRGGLRLTDASEETEDSASSAITASTSSGGGGGRSVPAILGRKRKPDTDMDMSGCFPPASRPRMEEPMEDVSENCPPVENLSVVERLQQQQQRLMPLQTSRIPLSTIQQSNQPSSSSSLILQTQSVMRRNSSTALPKITKSKESPPLQKSPVGSPPVKKMMLRQSWSEFREFSTQDAIPRSKTPLPTLNWVDRQDMWNLICKKESGMYRRKTSQQVLEAHPALQPRMRAILFDWLIEVCEVYRLHRETFYLAVDFIDRYLSRTSGMPKTRLQLIGVTCLFIGAKIEEIYPPKLSEFAYVTDGACNEEEILTMELVVLKELNWGLSPMTPNAWMKLFMQVANGDRRSGSTLVSPAQYSGLPFTRVMQLLDLCVLDITSLGFSYSVLAASTLAVSQGVDVACAVSGYSPLQLTDCLAWMDPFQRALKEECPVLAPRTFHNVPVENAHNIQSHVTDLKVLDAAQDIMLAVRGVEERKRRSPELTPTAAAAPLLEVTPPDGRGDVRYAQSARQTMAAATSSVFLSPTTPTSSNQRKLYSSFLKP